jgi:hypothetical protein
MEVRVGCYFHDGVLDTDKFDLVLIPLKSGQLLSRSHIWLVTRQHFWRGLNRIPFSLELLLM